MRIPLLVKLGEPVDRTLCEVAPLPQVQVTVSPARMVTLLGVKKLSPTVTSAVPSGVDAIAVNVSGEPVAPSRIAVAVWGPTLVPSVHVVLAMPLASVTAVAGFTAAPSSSVSQVTFDPGKGSPP